MKTLSFTALLAGILSLDLVLRYRKKPGLECPRGSQTVLKCEAYDQAQDSEALQRQIDGVVICVQAGDYGMFVRQPGEDELLPIEATKLQTGTSTNYRAKVGKSVVGRNAVAAVRE